MSTFETTNKSSKSRIFGIKLANGSCLWFDTREERDAYFLENQ